MSLAKAGGFEYTALCDLGSYMSCSKVLSSSYSKILSHWNIVPKSSPLNIPNAAIGLIFYIVGVFHKLIVRSIPLGKYLWLFAATLSVTFSLFLAYVLKFILQDFCLVCVSSYIVNIIIFVATSRLVVSSERKIASKKL